MKKTIKDLSKEMTILSEKELENVKGGSVDGIIAEPIGT